MNILVVNWVKLSLHRNYSLPSDSERVVPEQTQAAGGQRACPWKHFSAYTHSKKDEITDRKR